jgi:RNA polymerase primary sigma factor
MRQLKISGENITKRTENSSRYFTEVERNKLVSPDEEWKIGMRAQQGDEKAIDALVKANLRFVISVAKQYAGTAERLEDLISQGNIGLIYAARTFDPTRGFRFSTYAKWKILGEISNALSDEAATVRIPHSRKDRKQFNKSIHDQVGKQEGSDTYADLYLVSEPDPNPTDSDLGLELAEALGKLKPRQAEAICRFFGFGYDYAQTTEQIGNEMGIGAEAARLLVRGAERSLKGQEGIESLRDYL